MYSKHDKPAQTIVVEGRKGGNQGLDIRNPLYIYNEDGSYSDEMKVFIMDKHFVYIVKCNDGSLYTGYAKDVNARNKA